MTRFSFNHKASSCLGSAIGGALKEIGKLVTANYRIIWFISKIGSNIDMTINPTTRPITRIMTGSNMEVMAMI
jgi:hypothetical protein